MIARRLARSVLAGLATAAASARTWLATQVARVPPYLPLLSRHSVRAVLDTSVLVSEHRHWLWLVAQQGYYQPIWSPFIVNELVRIRVELSIQHGVERAVYRERINQLVHLLSDVCHVVNHRHARVQGVLRDADDEPILATAVVARARYIVSLNTRDFPPDDAAVGVRFITPRDFLAELVAHHPLAGLDEQARRAGRRVP